MIRAASWSLLVAGGFLGGCASSRGFPPLWEHEEDLPGNQSEDRAWFGLATRTTGEDGARLEAIRPLVARVDDAHGSVRSHFLTPFGSHTKADLFEGTTFWPLIFDRMFGTEEERRTDKSDDDTAIFPLLWWGDEPDTGAYFAFFPFGGVLKNKLFADRVDFVAFPLYTHTQSGDWTSTHLLWPLIAWGESPTRSHFRILPFWSESDSPTRHERGLLWPIGNWSTYTQNDRTYDSWFVFPLLGHVTSRDGQYGAWTALFPFFEFAHDDRTGDDFKSIVWPFYKRFVRPGDLDSTWYWPFYGYHRSTTDDSSFYAWPFVWISDEDRGSYHYRHRYFVPFFMHRTTGPKDGTHPDDEIRAWPLFSWRDRPDGVTVLRVPELIPVFGWEPGETLYNDLITVFRWRGDVEGRVAWDGPLHLVSYRRSTSGAATLRLFWWLEIPLGGGS